jgi:hypothetical protein
MEDYDSLICRAILEKSELRNSEIRDYVWNHLRESTRPSKNSLNVTISNRLTRLSKNEFKRRVVGHKDVRYSFKNDKEREKALSRYLPVDDLSKVIVEALKSPSKTKTINTLQLKALISFGYTFLQRYEKGMIKAINDRQFGDLQNLIASYSKTVNEWGRGIQLILEDKDIQRHIEGPMLSADTVVMPSKKIEEAIRLAKMALAKNNEVLLKLK